MNNDHFSALYKISMTMTVSGSQIFNIPPSDIVSIAIINNYDTMTHPIIRVRLYTDISIIRAIGSDPSNLFLRINMDGGIYKMNTDEKSPVMVYPIKGFSFSMKAYIENKNIPSSYLDNYVDGEKKDGDLNTDIKVPIELFCYQEDLMHKLKQRVESIYTNMSLQTCIENVFSRNGISNCQMDNFHNQNKYRQILVPNLNISDSIKFFEMNYGDYEKGGQFYCDIDHPYYCNSSIDNGTVPIPIYVESTKSNDDMTGMQKINDSYYMATMAKNVSVLSETAIERVMNAKTSVAVHVKDLTVETTTMETLYGTSDTNDDISTPNILHKTENPFITSTYNARISEKTTSVDLSGSGFDIGKLKINTRYNLVFASPLRGANMNRYYRTTFACHVMTNLDSDLFIANSTFNFVSN